MSGTDRPICYARLRLRASYSTSMAPSLLPPLRRARYTVLGSSLRARYAMPGTERAYRGTSLAPGARMPRRCRHRRLPPQPRQLSDRESGGHCEGVQVACHPARRHPCPGALLHDGARAIMEAEGPLSEASKPFMEASVPFMDAEVPCMEAEVPFMEAGVLFMEAGADG
eukprot:749706-Rhodomonas_salina.1